jgi:hypothetical protein
MALWLVWILQVRRGIERKHQLAYGIAVTFAGTVLAVAAVSWSALSESPPDIRPVTSELMDTGWMIEAIRQSRWKITLFAVTLTAFIVSAAFFAISDSTRGILAGLPIVPFGGLVSVAGDFGTGVEERLQIFRGMIGSVWLGPVVAVWFIYGLASFYGAREASTVKWRNESMRFFALVTGWAACFLAIIAISQVILTLPGMLRNIG